MGNRVSIIMPVYKAKEYVNDTIQSVLSSDYENIEVVCMDDGSTDNSLSILKDWAKKYNRVKVLHQENAGVCAARNEAIKNSKGVYILPVDADNILMPHFVSEAVNILDSNPNVKVVAPTIEYFGGRTGISKIPKFSLSLLARKNFIDVCAMYRRCDFERTEGYCSEIIAREDWEFWIALLKNGGDVVIVEDVSYKYRVLKDSKRVKDRALKHHMIDVLNKRHPEFFKKYLGGPLRYNRTYSRLINFFCRLFGND